MLNLSMCPNNWKCAIKNIRKLKKTKNLEIFLYLKKFNAKDTNTKNIIRLNGLKKYHKNLDKKKVIYY